MISASESKVELLGNTDIIKELIRFEKLRQDAIKEGKRYFDMIFDVNYERLSTALSIRDLCEEAGYNVIVREYPERGSIGINLIIKF